MKINSIEHSFLDAKNNPSFRKNLDYQRIAAYHITKIKNQLAKTYGGGVRPHAMAFCPTGLHRRGSRYTQDAGCKPGNTNNSRQKIGCIAWKGVSFPVASPSPVQPLFFAGETFHSQ
ncbi:hypothetical protein [Diaphorobacter sp.]|uniref:hypothetical protein n=1 Tax=Diaphorobacter sp. TaxID=1934310 RepID=UPI003D0E1935